MLAEASQHPAPRSPSPARRLTEQCRYGNALLPLILRQALRWYSLTALSDIGLKFLQSCALCRREPRGGRDDAPEAKQGRDERQACELWFHPRHGLYFSFALTKLARVRFCSSTTVGNGGTPEYC